LAPLELQGNEFKEIFSRTDRKQDPLLVVREGLAEEVKSYFSLEEV
jgi:hypothetical protein